jgi:Domain of unknown function (DUF5916)
MRAGGGLHRVSRAGTLEGLGGLPRPGFNAEVKPYGLGGVLHERQTSPRSAISSGQWGVGTDLKWEMRPGLVLDGTVQPDFAQVEADQQIVNLSRFERRRAEGHLSGEVLTRDCVAF